MSRLKMPLIAVLSLAVAACGDTPDNPRPSDSGADVEGRVTDDDSTARTGGSGSASAATNVEAVVVSSGEAQVVGTAAVDAEAEYALLIDESAEVEGKTVMLRAVDDSGATVASTLITQMDEPGDDLVYIAAPMTTETSVEAEVWLESRLTYGDEDGADSSEARVRIDADIAVSVRDSSDPDEEIRALSDALIASAETEARLWAESDAELLNDTRADATAEAMAEYDAALAEGGDIDGAWMAVLDARSQATLDGGLDARLAADASSASNLVFRAMIDAKASSSELKDDAVVASSRLEARATADAMVATYQESDADDSVKDDAAALAADLRADARAATSVSAAAQAWADFEEGAVDADGSSSEDSLLESTIDVGAIGEIAVEEMLDDADGARLALDADLTAAIEAAVVGTLDAETLATSVVTSWATYKSDVRTAVELVVTDAEEADLASSVLVDARGRFAVSPR